MQRKKRTKRGWEFYVQWKGGSGDWVAMKDLKYSHLVPLADYATANDIQDEPYFSCWVPFNLRKRISIIQKIKSKYWQMTHSTEFESLKTYEKRRRLIQQKETHYGWNPYDWK